MNIIQIFKKFPNKITCIKHLEYTRWKEGICCPYCQSNNTTKLKYDLRHHCNTCNTHFSVLVNTIFHDTRLPLQKWFLAIALILNAKKGLSSRQLARDIEVNKNTAWSMQMRIRQAMQHDGKFMTGIVEMDETYIGGKPRRYNVQNDQNKPNKRGRGTKKQAVVGIIERNGNVHAEKKDILSFQELKKVFDANAKNAVLVTDDYKGYIPFKKNVEHKTVNHSRGEYANGGIHTNNIEGFWALLKRGVMGQYHHVSKKYLNEYIREFCFRFNHRKLDASVMFNSVLVNMMRAY